MWSHRARGSRGIVLEPWKLSDLVSSKAIPLDQLQW